MKLFVVNRYGVDESGNSDDAAVQKKRLDDLLKKAQKRKEESIKLEATPVELPTPEPKKKKKRRSRAEPAEAPNDEPITDLGSTNDSTGDVDSSASKNNQQQLEGFTVIGRDQFKKIKEAKGVAPKWLAQPTVISVDMKNLESTYESLDILSPVLRNNLKDNNVENIFPVQREVIPWLLKEHRNSLTGYWPRDLCVSAPTGSGKTLAFALPLIQLLMDTPAIEAKALIVLPVQDLAKQVFNVFQTYIKGTNVKVALATGQGQLDEEQRQLIKKDVCGNFQSLVHVIITTPGRLVNHLRDTDGLDLSKLRFLVVDEADRVMDGAQSDWLYHLERHIAQKRHSDTSKKVLGQVPPLSLYTFKTQQAPPQKLLFSATLSQDPEKLARLALFQPKLFTCIVKPKNQTEGETPADPDMVGHFAMPAEIKETFVLCEDEGAKPLLLHCLLTRKAEKLAKRKGRGCKTLCFAATRLAAHRLCLLLRKLDESSETKLRIAEISSELKRPERNKILESFTSGDIDVIVSSDALARGIDIPTVDCVVSYDVPLQAKLHVHRVGRTGRAGRKGEAITILMPQQLPSFQHMLRSASRDSTLKQLKGPLEEMEAMEDAYKEALGSVRATIEDEKKHTLFIKKKKIGAIRKRKTVKKNEKHFGRQRRLHKKNTVK